MANQFSTDEDDRIPEKRSSQQLLLLLLLLLLAIFAYLYFFTGMIRPREPATQPQPAPVAMVKKPLPPRLEQKGALPATPGVKPAAATKEAETAATPVKEATKPASAPAVKVAPAAKPAPPASEAKATKPQVAAPQAKTEKPTASSVPAPPSKTAKPEAPAGKEAKSVAVSEKKPVAKEAAEKSKPAANHATGESSKTAKKVAVKPTAAAYLLELKDDLAPSEIGPVMAKLKQAGIGHVVKTKTQKGEPMHRLFLADFGNRDEALEELERLKLASPDAFMLKENGRYAVYAGSYLREAKATVEQERLLAKGVKLLVKDATAPVAVVKVRAGSFADQASAEKAAKSLKKGGLSAKVVKIGS